MQCQKSDCKPDWNEWSAWSECSSKCGIGTRTRIKKCSNLDFNFPCESTELIMERTICSSNISCPELIPKWSDWSEWSICSVECGQGYSARKRECLGNTSNCEGPSTEIKVCTNRSGCKTQTTTESSAKIFTASWSEWSEWSECFSKDSCGFGIKVKKRYCLVGEKIVSNSECNGPSFNSSECFISNCSQNKIEISKNEWSVWSNCSTGCGVGLKTRFRKCFSNEKNCDKHIYGQETCQSFINCLNESK